MFNKLTDESVSSEITCCSFGWNENCIVTRPELFLKVRCTDSDVFDTFAETCPPNVHSTEESLQYPPDGSALTSVVLYLRSVGGES